MRSIFIMLFHSLFWVGLVAQSSFHVQLSPEPVLSSHFQAGNQRSYFLDSNDVCFVDQEPFKKKLKNVYIARFDKKTLAFKSHEYLFSSDDLDKSSLNMSYQNIVELDENYYIIASKKDPKKHMISFYAIHLNQHFSPSGTQVFLLDIPYSSPYVAIKVYKDRKKNNIVIYSYQDSFKADEISRVYYALIGADLKVAKDGTYWFWDKNDFKENTFPYFSMDKVSVAPANILYNIQEYVDRRDNTIRNTYRLSAVDMMNGKSIVMTIDEVMNPVSASLHADDDYLYVYGFYKTGEYEGVDGQYLIIISRDDMSMDETISIPFDKDIVKKIMYSKKSDHNTPRWASGISLLITTAGEKYIVGEQTDETVIETSTVGTLLFHVGGSIIITKMDADNNIDWVSTIPRRYSSRYYDPCVPFATLVDDRLVLIYNDVEKNFNAATIDDLVTLNPYRNPEVVQLVGVNVDTDGAYSKTELTNAHSANGLMVLPAKIPTWNYNDNTWVCSVNHQHGKEFQVGMMRISLDN